jgi:hypothetical protein
MSQQGFSGFFVWDFAGRDREVRELARVWALFLVWDWSHTMILHGTVLSPTGKDPICCNRAALLAFN